MSDYGIPILAPIQIRHLRMTLGWSQARLGEFLARDGATVSRWEAGLYEPDPLAAGVLYRLWLHVFGDDAHPAAPQGGRRAEPVPEPAQPSETLQALGKLLLTVGVGYLIAKGFDELPDDE